MNIGKKNIKSVSHEPLVVERWLTPQNDRKTRFTIGVVIHIYPSDKLKCPKMHFILILGPYRGNFENFHPKPMVAKSGFTLKMTTTDPQVYTNNKSKSFYFNLII